MDTLGFLNFVLPPAPSYYAQLLGPNNNGVNYGSVRHPSLESLAYFIDKVAASKKIEIYISMSGFTADAPGHYATHGTGNKSHYVDMDAGPGKPYANSFIAYQALAQFYAAHPDFPRAFVVVSGNGLHLYWPYTKVISQDEFRATAYLLRAVLQHAGLQIDGKCGIDPVRLLRPPGTYNYKKLDDPKPVFVPPRQEGYQPMLPARLSDWLAAYKAQHGLQGSVHLQTSGAAVYDSDLAAGLKEPYSVLEAAKGCEVLRWHIRNGGDPLASGLPGMHQPVWFEVARAYKFSTEGWSLFMEHAAQYTGYSARKANALSKRIDFSGPLCSEMANGKVEAVMCARCPNKGKIKSPVVLGARRVIPIQPAPVERDTLSRPSAAADTGSAPEESGTDMFGTPDEPDEDITSDAPEWLKASPYLHAGNGLFFKPGDPTKPAQFISPFVIIGFQRFHAAGQRYYNVKLQSRVHGTNGSMQIVDAQIPAEKLARPTEVKQILCGRGVVLHETGREERFMGYLKHWQQHDLMHAEEPLITQMGWQSDDSFVIGTDRYVNGERVPAVLETKLAESMPYYETRGTLEGHINTIRTLCQGGSERNMQFLFAVGVGLGSTNNCDPRYPGAVASLYSPESGRGKTVAGWAMTGLFGDPRQTQMEAARASLTAINNRLAMGQNLPLLLDEATHNEADRVQVLLSAVTSGKTFDRAETNGHNRVARTFSCFALVTTNVSMLALLQQQYNGKERQQTKGEQARLLEVEVDPHMFSSEEEANDVSKQLFWNFGHVGREFIRRLTKCRPESRERFEALQARLKQEWRTGLGMERVWLASFTSIILHLQMANEWGLLGFDCDMRQFETWCYRHYMQMCGTFRETFGGPLEELRNLLAKVRGTNCVVIVERNNTLYVDNVDRLGHTPTARYEVHTHELFVHESELKRHLNGQLKSLLEAAKEAKITTVRTRKNVFAQTDRRHESDKANGYTFNMRELDAALGILPEPDMQRVDNVTPLRG